MMAEHIFTRDELWSLVWSKPMKTQAQELGISDVGLAKACRKVNIPRPPRGYWAKLKAGKPVHQIPLPVRGPGMDNEVVVGGGRCRKPNLVSRVIQTGVRQGVLFYHSVVAHAVMLRDSRRPWTIQSTSFASHVFPQLSVPASRRLILGFA